MSKEFRRLYKMKLVPFITIFIIIAVGFGCYWYYIYYTSQKFKEVIYPGLKIENLDVGGKTQEEVLSFLNEKYDKPLENGSINVKLKNKNHELTFKDLNAGYNSKKIVQLAFNYGKDLNYYDQYKLIKNPKSTNFNLSLSYDKEPIQELLNNLDKSLGKEIVNASISKNGDNFIITKEKVLEEFDKNLLYEDIISQVDKGMVNINIEAPIKVTEPPITEKQLRTIDSVISSFSTKFVKNERSINIAIAAKATSGILLMPGDVYSFNKLIGDTTPEKGYKEAPIIKNDKIEPGYGGGICQVSTTLHNAVLRAGIIPIQRMHHSQPVAYVVKGTDATVFYNSIDYKFKNTLNYPIYIEGYTLNNEIVFKVYSNSSLKNNRYEIVSKDYKKIPRKIKYIKDVKLDEGEKIVDKSGSDGYKVKVFRITYANGIKVNENLIYDDFYKPVDKIVKING